MKELLKTNRISLSKSYHYWRMYYLAPAFLAFGGTYGIIAGLYRGKNFDQLYVVIVFALLGWGLLYWLDRQLHFKTYHVEGSIQNLRDKLYSTMEADGWEFKNKAKKYAIATKGKEFMAVTFETKSYKVCLTGNFILLGPLLSIVPYYPQGKKILKSLNVPNNA